MDDLLQFISDVRKNEFNNEIIRRLPFLELNDPWLVAGCLFQTVWNLKANNKPEEKIYDYDIFYYDLDTSWGAEDLQIKKIKEKFSDLPIKVELRNQARVPIWYKQKFGFEYPPVTCAKDPIARFIFCCNCIGITLKDGQIDVYAPFGLKDIYGGILRPNHSVDSYTTEESRKKKAENYLARWPWLKVLNY